MASGVENNIVKLEQLQAKAFRIIREREQNARAAQAKDAELEKELAQVLAEIAKDEDRNSKRG